MVGLVEVLLPKPNLHDHIAPVGRFELHPAKGLSASLSSPLIDDRKILVSLKRINTNSERRGYLPVRALDVRELLDQF